MAAKDGSKRLTVVKKTATSPDRFDAAVRVDAAVERIDDTYTLAVAIADALKVLTALERAESIGSYTAGHETGKGMADGHVLLDDTMPDLAAHLRGFIDEMHADASVIREEYDRLNRLCAEAANG